MLTSTLPPPMCDHELAEPTLDDAICRLWGRVITARDVSCPWCGGTMHPRYGAGARPVGARCQDCGASLS